MSTVRTEKSAKFSQLKLPGRLFKPNSLSFDVPEYLMYIPLCMYSKIDWLRSSHFPT